MTIERHDDDSRAQQAGDRGVGECDEAVRQLYNFLDNELTPEMRAAFEAHLNDCGPCVEIVTFEAELRRVIANKCQDRVPDELRERIASAIHNEADSRS
ncbi:MAG TPA: mycothiol system anti-sigma-R factor [Acidimicrobiales bacterium]|jgi:mycothiol system anti-sigma-R factor|nr:mycothiol system anti-sigma-R factor [Acidimicrobiales bacterium]